MTNNLKPFDLEAAKRGEPVVTRDGRKARIVCFDYDSEFALLGLIEESVGRDLVCMFSEDGRCYSEHRNRDLFMAAPAIPEGFTAYDPNVPPPEDAEELELLWSEGTTIFFKLHKNDVWEHMPGIKRSQTLKAYRVTKWKEVKPSLQKLAHDIAILTNNDEDDDECKTIEAITGLLNQFADAIVQRAVDKSREDRG